MSSLSIKTKMMFWYAFVMLVIIALAMSVLISMGDKLTRDGAKQNLSVSTDRALKDVRIVDGKLTIDDDVMYYSSGAYVVIFKDDGTQVSGLELEGFPKDVPFEADTIREVKRDGTSYYVYDRLIENKRTGKIWVRGMTSAELSQISPGISRMIKIFLFVLPVLLILAIIGGWYMTTRAFAPLKEIYETAEKIHDGNDLSLRIGVDEGGKGDEITQTARVFDRMLDSIEQDFESEKRFTDDASHELRTPTAVIMSQSEYALNNLDDGEEVEEALKVILAQSNKMKNLLDRLLMLARADKGTITLNKEKVEIGLLVESAAANVASRIKTRNTDIKINISEDIFVEADVSLMERAFENVIGNGVKYGIQDGHIWIDAMQNGQEVVISISDDGIGIADDQIDKIWERFYRIDGGGDHDSMGLGLSLTKWIVEAHDGKIDVSSKPGEGSTFAIKLPVAKSGENA